jgi:integrase/recombinase XerD
MIEDMSVRDFTEKTRSDYVRNVRAFAAFIGRSPDTATAQDLRRFQLHQTAACGNAVRRGLDLADGYAR